MIVITGRMKRAGMCGAAGLLLGGVLFAQTTNSAYLKTKIKPGRAGVFVDGKYLGPAANFRIGRKYALPASMHEVKLVEPRYEEYTTTVELTAGKTTVVSQALTPLPLAQGPFGTLRVKNPDKFAAVYVNDRFYGHVDEFSNSSQGLLLPAGEYAVRVEPVAGGAPVEKKIQIDVGKTAIVE